tara:strand:+ start:416 stop:679 length:264 start_codon:yes stop_codon:yes gene_type:complete
MKKKKDKLTYKDMIEIIGSYRKELLIVRNEISGLHFLINSFLEMHGDVEKLTKFIKGTIEEKKNSSTDREKEQAKGSRTSKIVSKSG